MNWATRQADERRAARMAYRTLLAMGSGRLPVDVLGIVGKCRDTVLMTYAAAGQSRALSVYGMAQVIPSLQACTLRYQYGARLLYIVLYNDDECFSNWGSRRWSLAHELGHIVLGHERDTEGAEREANCFAQHLLCPRPLLEALPAADAETLEVAFGLSREAARIAAQGSARRCALVDEEMRRAIRALYAIGDAPAWQDVLSATQMAAYRAKIRRALARGQTIPPLA